MTTVNRIIKMVDGLGFTPVDEPGFVAFKRTRSDGVEQSLRVFSWSNKKHAAADNMPHAYLVLCPGFTGDREQIRVAVLVCQWPSIEQMNRPWKDVEAQVRESFLPLFDLPDFEQLNAVLKQRTYSVANVPFPVLL